MRSALAKQYFLLVFLTFAALFGVLTYRILNMPYDCEAAAFADMPLGILIDSLINSVSLRLWIVGLLIVTNALLVMRVNMRYNVSMTRNFLSSVLFLVGGYSIFVAFSSLAGSLSVTLMVLASSNMASSFKRKNRFGSVFGAMFCIGLLPLLHSSFIMMFGLVPFMLFIFDRTAREAIVAVGGLSTPLLFSVFGWWMAGESTSYIFTEFIGALLTPARYGVVDTILGSGLPVVVFVGILMVFNLYCIVFSIAHLTIMRTRTGRIHIYSILFFIFILLMLAIPSSNIFMLGMLGIPLSQYGSFALVYKQRWLNIVIYVMLVLSFAILNLRIL